MDTVAVTNPDNITLISNVLVCNCFLHWFLSKVLSWSTFVVVELLMSGCRSVRVFPVFVQNLNSQFPHAEVQSKHHVGPSCRYLECLTDG